MTITERAAKVLQEIDGALALADKATLGRGSYSTINPAAEVPSHYVSFGSTHVANVRREPNAAFIAASRTLLPASLRCLKTAIEGLLAAEAMIYAVQNDYDDDSPKWWVEQRTKVIGSLTTLCNQWNSK